MQQTAVSIVDQQELVMDGIAEAIASTPDLRLAGRWTRLGAARESWSGSEPDVAIVEAQVLGRDALSGLEELRRSHRARVLLRAPRAEADFVQLAMRAGAYGVVAAHEPRQTVIGAIRSVAAGTRYVPLALRAMINDRLLAGALPCFARLTTRERQVVTHAAEGATVLEISAELLIGSATVRTHLSNAYAKLGVSSRTEAVLELLRLGVVDVESLRATRGAATVLV